MAETPEQASDCKACDIAFNALMVLGVAAVAFLAWDTLSNGKATELAGRLLSKARPALAQVIPFNGQDEADDADAG